ncbi:hypothetical protein [Brassicibacter mesophilus]
MCKGALGRNSRAMCTTKKTVDGQPIWWDEYAILSDEWCDYEYKFTEFI